MQKHCIETTRTARYFTMGNRENPASVIFLFHGYAQKADDFLNQFKALHKANTLLVSFEGLSKLYFKDFTNKPGASWMTSLERESEISDYLTYFNKVLKALNLAQATPIYGIGFSQGCATLSRWFVNCKLNWQQLFFIGGTIAHDLDLVNSNPFLNTSNHFICGDNDPLISTQQIQENKEYLNKLNIPFKTFTFMGRHEIVPNVVTYILDQL